MSCNQFLNVFDRGNGIIKSSSPPIRLITGLFFFCATIILPITKPAGSIMLLVIPIICILIYRPALDILKNVVLFGLMMFSLLFLLIPVVPNGSSQFFDIQRFTDISVVLIPLALFLKGILTIIIFTSTTSSLNMSEFVEAQIRLKVPTFVVMLITQIIQQTGLLYSETVQMSQAMSLRGGAPKIKTALLFSRYAPRIWLERIYYKAHRVSDAMTIRNYEDLPSIINNTQLKPIDILFVSFGLITVVLSILIRYDVIL